MKADEITQKITVVAQFFDKELPPGILQIYVTEISRYSDEQINNALSDAVRKSKFFPRLAELIEMIEGPAPTRQDRAALAWSELIGAIEKHGSYKSVIFADTAITAAVKAMGGWLQVCSWTEEELHWRQKEFMQLYGGLQAQKGLPKRLAGREEIENSAEGYEFSKPVYIGSPAGGKALSEGEQPSDKEILRKIMKGVN